MQSRLRYRNSFRSYGLPPGRKYLLTALCYTMGGLNLLSSLQYWNYKVSPPKPKHTRLWIPIIHIKYLFFIFRQNSRFAWQRQGCNVPVFTFSILSHKWCYTTRKLGMFISENYYFTRKRIMACIILEDALVNGSVVFFFAYFTRQVVFNFKFCFDEKFGIFTSHFQKCSAISNSVTLPMHSGFTI